MKKNPSIIKNAVLKMGGTIEEFVPERGCFYINIAGKRILLERKISISRQSFVSGQLTRCKDLTDKLLCAHGLPTPKTECFYNKSYKKSEAKKQLSQLKYPIILKNARGSNSRGIFPFIGNLADAEEVLAEKLPHYRSMVGQEMVEGKEFRILILDEKVIGALEMIPPYALGDGVSTIGKIIKRKQKDTERRTEFDEKLEQILKEQNVTLQSVMQKNEIAFIKKNSCLAEGGETKDVTDIVHSSVEEVCVKAAKVVGKHLVGIDVMCEDISRDITEQSFHIIEINGKPDLYIHYNPTIGKTRNVVEEIVKFMIKEA